MSGSKTQPEDQQTQLQIETVPYDHPVAAQLVHAALTEIGERYGGEGDETPVEASDFEPPRGTFLIARLDGRPVGCGAWRSHDEDTAEIKRMYTVPEARGRGIARTLLETLEASARAAGKKRIILETGDRQPEAIALYESRGYQRIPNYGYYRDDPGTISFGRTI